MHHDGMHFFPLPRGSNSSTHGLLVVNHEYTDDGLLHTDGMKTWTADKVRKSQAAHGVSVIEIEQENGVWRVVAPSRYARRITAFTPIALSGPAAGDDALKTVGRSVGPRSAGHVQQLRERHHAVGHLPRLRRELQFLLQRRSHDHAGDGPLRPDQAAAGCAGTSTTRASTARRSRTRRTASAGWSRSTRGTPRRSPSSAPRSAASSTRAQRSPSRRTGASSTTWATTKCSSTSTSS